MTRYDILRLRQALLRACPEAAADIDAMTQHALLGQAVHGVMRDHAGSRAVTRYLDEVVSATVAGTIAGDVARVSVRALREVLPQGGEA